MKILITGCAGFIGFHLTNKIISSFKNIKVIGVDNLNKYYSSNLKRNRLKILKSKKNFNFKFLKVNLENYKKIKDVFRTNKIDYIIHLAAQPGVRYSIENPRSYINANLMAFFNIIDLAKDHKIKHFIYASTSSVYGDSKKFPIDEKSETTRPISLYAATKKSNELLSYSYANIFKLPSTALRFFTVYGPYGRPDMSLFNFTDNIFKNKTVNLFNKGNHKRDFTYIDDVINPIIKLIKKPPNKIIPYRVLNIGSGKCIKLTYYLKEIEKITKRKAKIKKLSLQKGDIGKTHANINLLFKITKYKPKTSLTVGIKNFISWYKSYYGKK